MIIVTTLGSSLTIVRITSYIDVKFRFLLYFKHSFLRENDKSFERNYNNYMAICKELLVLNKRIVWQLDQPERAVIEHEFV